MNPACYLLFFNSLITGFLFLYSLRFRHSRGSLSFTLLMLAATIYSFGYSMELMGGTFQEMRGWLHFKYVGISFLPALWLIFVLRYLQFTEWTTPRWIAVYLSISCITLILISTNQYHHLFFSSIQLGTQGGFPVLVLGKGIWSWIHICWFNLIILVSTLLFANKLIASHPRYRNQYLLMLLGSLAPWISYIIYLAKLGPEGIDLSPFTATITGILFGWGIFFFHMLDVVPLALDHVFWSMRDGVIVLDHHKRIIHYNEAAQKIFSTIGDHSLGITLLKEIDQLPELSEIKPLLSLDAGEISIALHNPPVFIHLHLSPVTDPKNKILGYLLVIHDITAQRTFEKTLQENEQALRELNATKDKLLSIMAHDLRSPFSMIQSLVSAYNEKDFRLNETETAELLRYLYEASLHGSSILENMLFWTRAQTGKLDFKPVEVNFSVLLHETLEGIRTAAMKKNISLRSEVPENSCLQADQNMLQIILRNLLMNAIKFTADGGMVKTDFHERPYDYLLEVSDTGIGMDQQEIDSLFSASSVISKPGTQGEKGTGLGLLVCKEFITMHQGNMQVYSQPGKGSTFSITIPKPSYCDTH